MATKVVLDFEKPLVELEVKLGEMRQCLRSSSREQAPQETEALQKEIGTLEKKLRLCASLYTGTSPVGRRCSLHAIRNDPIRLIIFI